MKVTVVVIALLLAACLLMSEVDAKRRRNKKKNRVRGRGRRFPNPHPRPHPPPLPPQPKDCGPIPHVVHGQGLDTGTGVHYACQPGFRLEGTNVITCVDGRWTVAPRCVKELCPSPPHAPFAHPPELMGSGASANYKCLSGYQIVGGNGATSKTISCLLSTRNWGAIPACELKATQTCGAPPSITNGMSTVSGNTATYTCNPGYVRKAGTPSTLKCSGHQWIVSVMPACVRDPTTTPPPAKCTKSPPCGDATITRGDVADSYDVGSKIKYTCVPGYKITGSKDNTKNMAEIECKADGTWAAAPTCEKVDCGMPPSGVKTKPVMTMATKFGDMYTYECIANYETGAATTTTCQADGKWSTGEMGPTCTAKVCKYSALPKLENGGTTGIAMNADTKIGGTVIFQCTNNFRIAPRNDGQTTTTFTVSTQVVTCQENGTFTPLMKSCVFIRPSSCKDFYTRDNLTPGAEVSIMIDPDGTGSGSAVAVTCSGSSTEVCTGIAPSTGATLSTPNGMCTQSSLATVLPAATTFTTGNTVAGCSRQEVGYPMMDDMLNTIIRTSNNCEQIVTVMCAATADTNLNGRILVVRSNNDIAGVALDTQGAGTDFSDISGLFPQGTCDCGRSASCTTTTNACNCSPRTGAGRDTYTIALNGDTPKFVEEIGIVITQSTGTTPTTTTADFSATVGEIKCCENMS